MARRLLQSLGLFTALFLPALPSHSQGASRTYVNEDIFIAQGQQIHNATCLFCSVQVEGEITGRVIVLFGNLNVTGRVHGSAIIIGGNAVIDSLARLGGSAVVVGGNAVYESDEAISGNAWVIGGHMSPVGSKPMHTAHRFSFGPALFSGVALVALLLLSLLLIPRRRSEPV